MNNYMKNKNIDFELQGKVRKYLEYMMHSETDIEKEKEIFNKLTYALKKELILQSNGKYINQIPLFTENFSIQTLENLPFVMKERKFCPEEYIYHVKFFVQIHKKALF